MLRAQGTGGSSVEARQLQGDSVQATANEDQVRQAIEEMPNLQFLPGFRTYPRRARMRAIVPHSRPARHDSAASAFESSLQGFDPSIRRIYLFLAVANAPLSLPWPAIPRA